jgi:hypothetical protein
MKKYKLYMFGCVIALAALFLPGCNSEETLIDNSAKVEKGKLSFVLPLGGKKAVTYATTEGLDEEYELHNIRIYWFDAADNLYKRFSWGEGTSWGEVSQPDPDPIQLFSGDNKTLVTISVGEYDQPSKFYIVANVNGDGTHPDMITSSGLLDIQNGQAVTRQEFEAILSDALNAGSVKMLGVPIPMSIPDTTETPGGYIEVPKPNEASSPIEAKLKRRVARFDIVNSADYSNFEITKIVVSKAQTKGFMHDSLFSKYSAASWDAANTYKFEVTAPIIADTIPPFNGPRLTKSINDTNGNGIDDAFDSGELDSIYTTKAAFYLYPTTIEQGDAKTQIAIEGVYNKTVNRIYTLDLSDATKFPGNKVDIEANKLYRIRVVRNPDYQLHFELDIADWDDVDTIMTREKGEQKISSWGILSSTANASLTADIDTLLETSTFVYEYSSSATKPDTLVFQTQGYGLSSGATNLTTEVAFIEREDLRAGIDYLASDFSRFDTATIISTTDLTYATGGIYTTTHKVVLPPTIAPIEVILQIKNAVNGADNRFIKIKSNNYAMTGYKPVAFEGLIWAPVNVGATLLPDPIDAAGNMDKIDTKASSPTLFAQVAGNYYQWGRNVPFSSTPDNLATADKISTTFFTLQGALDTLQFSTVTTPNNGQWLNPWSNDLWTDPKNQPCPPGWRIPTKEELTTLKDKAANASIGARVPNSWFRITTPNQERLYFPACGYRLPAGTMTSRWGDNSGDSFYYSSNSDRSYLKFNRGPDTNNQGAPAIGVSGNYTNAMNIRAVLDIANHPE